MSSQNPLEKIREKVGRSLSGIRKRYIVLSGKGGVGKTSVSANIAAALADKNKKSAILDIDLHGPNIPRLLRIKEKAPEFSDGLFKPLPFSENLLIVSPALFNTGTDEPAIWRGPVKSSYIRHLLTDVEWGKLDYLIVDSPPGTGDEPLSAAQLIPPPFSAIIVTTPQEVAVDDAKKTASFCSRVGLPISGIIENMSGMQCPHCKQQINLYKRGGGKLAATELGLKFLGKIPFDPRMVISSDKGIPFVLEFKDSQAAVSLRTIAEEL